MATVQVERLVGAAAWNAGVAEEPTAGTIFQTTWWADYYAAYLGDTFHFLTVKDGAAVIGRLLVQETLRGQESVLGGPRARLRRAVTPLLRVLLWRQGPVVCQPGRGAEVLRACLDAVETLAAERDVTGIDEAYLPIERAGGEGPVFAERGYRAEPHATVLIDVAQPLERLWESLKKDVARTPIRKAQKDGVMVRETHSPADVRRFHELVSEWRRDQGFPPYDPSRYETMVSRMGRHCRVFLAEHDGQLMGGAGLWHFNRRAHLFTPVHARAARERRIYVGDLLFWEIIRWCHEAGLAVLDLSGVAPDPATPKEAGIRRFKEKWGGRVTHYAVFSKPLKPASWALTSLVRTVRRSARAVGVRS